MTAVLPIGAPTLAAAAKRLREGSLSPVDLVESCLQHVADYDDTVHAFVTVTADMARAQAQRAKLEIDAGGWRGPLHGVPIGIKDVIDVAGVPSRAQSPQMQHYVAARHAAAVARLIESGAVIVGKLTTHEFAFGLPPKSHGLANGLQRNAVTFPGPAAVNPWCTNRFPGGSSSGAAVGVACGMMLGALGTDSAGSVRSPAALCGMTGFKPSRQTISRQGVFPLSPSLDSMGVIALTAEDCALMHAGIATPVSGRVDPASEGPSDMRILRKTLAKLRIGVARSFFDEACAHSPALRSALDAFTLCLREAGCFVVDAVLPPLAHWNAAGMTVLLREAYILHKPWLRERMERYGDSFATAVLVGAAINDGDYLNALNFRDALSSDLEAAMRPYDFMIAPIQPGEAPRHEDLTQWGFLARPSYGIPFNLADLPSISVCCGFGDGGMPLAVQVIGKKGDEAGVLQAAQAYQTLSPWHERARMPPLPRSAD